MDIKQLIGETTEYDKKEKLESRRPKSWCKSISAFANGIGGKLIFGINDEDSIIGLENAEKDAETISEQIKNFIDPTPEFELDFHKTEEGKKLIILNVDSGDDTPYYYIKDGSRLAFQRIGNETVQVDRFKLKSLVLKGMKVSFDSLATQYKIEDYSFSKLRATYKKATGDSFIDSDFESFGLVNEDGFLTNSGALIADDSPIRYSRLFCTRWNGLNKAGGVFDAIDDKEYSDGLIQLLEFGENFVKMNSKMQWKKTANSRIELPEYGERAVFEALVNALIHRDYLEYGSEIHIDMYDDRLVIYSPGGMFDGTTIQDVDPLTIASKRRNPVLADIFSRLKLMERRGSGFKKILEDYQRQELYSEAKKPLFYTINESFFVELKNLNYGDSEEVFTNVDKFNTKNSLDYLDDIDFSILQILKSNDSITLRELEDKLPIKRSAISKRINKLIENNIIERSGTSQMLVYKVLVDIGDKK